MIRAGKISSTTLKKVLSEIKPDISLLELDEIAEESILSLGGKPAFKKVRGYSHATCINVNEGIVHGIPNSYKLKKGDLVSVDLGVLCKGYNSDQCWTVEVETNTQGKFLQAGVDALNSALKQVKVGNRVGDISHAIQSKIEKRGYHVSRDLVGHGVGKEIHEAPQIPCYGSLGTGPFLKEGMTLAIEVIYSVDSSDIAILEDDWTVVNADGKLSAVFEHTVGVTSGDPVVFTEF